MSKLGTTAWADKTHGTMSFFDKVTLLKQEVQRQVTARLRCLHRNNIAYIEPVDLDDIPIPDSPLAVESLQYCEAVAPQSLFYHSLRTYYWGYILAKQANLQLDTELFYVTALYHDLGLCDAYNNQDRISECFAVEGGRRAREFVIQQGFPEKASCLEAAIIQHINLYVPISDSIEKHILPHATSLDVIGARVREIQPKTLAAVLEKYPRLSFKEDLVRLFNHEYENRPQSRIAFMHQVANLNRMIRAAPFES